MAGAEGGCRVDCAGGEAHHQERAFVGAVFGRGVGGCWRGGGAHEEVAVVLLVEGDGVGLVWVEGRIGACGDGETDSYLGCEADDLDVDVRGDEFADGGVYVVGVRGEKGAEEDEDLAGCVGGSVVEPAVGHVESVLQGGLAFGIFLAEFLDVGYVVVWVA